MKGNRDLKYFMSFIYLFEETTKDGSYTLSFPD